ncbi:MAG: hypothetical protein HQL09_03075 [Nitrospirae bacterium]|nr:hypothetical protein [Nitrospirota bacterium]
MKVIDIHTHGIGGYDTRSSIEEHILSIADIHGSLGVSEIILTIYPATIKVMRQNMETVRKAMEKQKARGVERRATVIRRYESQQEEETVVESARITGVHLEGPFLNFSRCGALNAMVFLEPAEYHLQELLEGFGDMVKIMTIAPEMNGAAKIIRKIADRGIIPSMGHSEATYNEAEKGFNAGARGITHIFNAMRPFHHREPGIIGFGLLNPEVYIEVIADAHHLHSATIDLIFKTKNPSRIIIVSDSVKASKTALYSQGVVDSIGRLMGGVMSVPEAASRLVAMGLDNDLVMKCITENPEKYLAGG